MTLNTHFHGIIGHLYIFHGGHNCKVAPTTFDPGVTPIITLSTKGILQK